jgi:hypothetical protein
MILIVDAQKDIGASLERLLRYAWHEAVSATGGAEELANVLTGDSTGSSADRARLIS